MKDWNTNLNLLNKGAFMIDKKKVEEVMEKSLISPSDAEMSEIPDVSRDYILALEDECNTLRELGNAYLSNEMFMGEWEVKEKKPYVVRQIEKWLQSAETSRKRPFKVCVVARTRAKLWEIFDIQKDIVFKMANEKRCGYVGFYYFDALNKALNLRKKLYNDKTCYVFLQDDRNILNG